MTKTVVEYCISILIILCNYCMYARIVGGGISEKLLTVILSFVCLLRILLDALDRDFKVVLRRKHKNGIILVVLFSLFAIIVPFYQVQLGLLLFVFPLTAFILMFSICENTRSLWNCFTNTMFVVAVISLFFYLFGSGLHIIQPTGIVRFNYDTSIRSCRSYFNLFFEAQKLNEASFLGVNIRNCGIFIEAPMYNSMLCLALLSELSFREKVRKSVVITLAITILTTMTTTGTLVLIAVLIVNVFKGGKNNFLRMLRVVVVPVMFLIALFVILTILNNKLNTAQGDASYSVRSDHVIAGFKMFLHSPIVGYGFGNTAAFAQFAEHAQGYAVGLPLLLGIHGGLFFALYLVPWGKLTAYSFEKKKLMYFYSSSFIVLFLTAIFSKPIMYMIICMQLVEAANVKRGIRKQEFGVS